MSPDAAPTFEEFLNWSGEQVAPYVKDKVIDFSPGGSSRWYFYNHGDPAKGYDDPETFMDYSRRGLQRTVEITNLMFQDGIRTVMVIAVMPGQFKRDASYVENFSKALGLIADDEAARLYARNEIGVCFRGKWNVLFEKSGQPEFWATCQQLEQKLTAQFDHWLVWLTDDDFIPSSLSPYIQSALETEGKLPDQKQLAQAYYGRPLELVDLYIGHNKPSLTNQTPPLMTIGDVYYTATPSYDFDRYKWRLILYDHLFSRRGASRDYTAMGDSAIADYRHYYETHRDVVIGVGTHHAPTQTWRPVIPPSLRSDASV